MSSFPRQHVHAERPAPGVIVLRLQRWPGAIDLAFDFNAPVLDRLLAAVAAGQMRPAVVAAALAEDDTLRRAVVALEAAERGPRPAAWAAELRVDLMGASRV